MLENALDMGISEQEFWNMTIGELERKADSCRRLDKHRLKEKATFDYTLAMLIGRAFGASEEHPFPGLYDVYPNLFADDIKRREEEESARQAQLSAIRFIQFAQSFNKKFAEEANNE
jgi:hypothetical protein